MKRPGKTNPTIKSFFHWFAGSLHPLREWLARHIKDLGRKGEKKNNSCAWEKLFKELEQLISIGAGI